MGWSSLASWAMCLACAELEIDNDPQWVTYWAWGDNVYTADDTGIHKVSDHSIPEVCEALLRKKDAGIADIKLYKDRDKIQDIANRSNIRVTANGTQPASNQDEESTHNSQRTGRTGFDPTGWHRGVYGARQLPGNATSTRRGEQASLDDHWEDVRQPPIMDII